MANRKWTEKELTDWWVARAREEADAVVPKAIEYGSNSMIEVGRSMARLAKRSEISDSEAIELACMFYIKGKLGRWLDAAAAGSTPSDDTIYDIGIYIKMAQRAREVGSWPGVGEPTIHINTPVDSGLIFHQRNPGDRPRAIRDNPQA